MSIFGRKSQKEIDLAINHLNQILIQHFKEWDRVLKFSLGAEACSQQPIEKVAPAFRIMWIECHKRALLMLAEARRNYHLVTIKTPAIELALTAEEYDRVSAEQMKRMGELMGLLMRKTCDLNPSHEDELNKLLEEPELGKIKAEAKEQLGI